MAASSTFQPVSVAVSAGIGLYRSVSEAGIGPNKKKNRIGALDAVSGQVRCGCGGPRAAPVLSSSKPYHHNW